MRCAIDRLTGLAAVLLTAWCVSLAGAKTIPVDQPEACTWADYVIPLPKEIAITGKRIMSVSRIKLRGQTESGPTAHQALLELQKLFNADTQADQTPAVDGGGFTITIGLPDAENRLDGVEIPGAGQLRALPNHDQAYVIRPINSDQLVIAALNEKGLYYGVQTFKQLVEPFRRDGQAAIPMAKITDWPDMAERGLWNSGRETPGFIAWLASLKLNFEHISHPVSLMPDEERCPPLPLDQIALARAHAFHLMPHCAHYDFWLEYKNNKNFYPPDLTGHGDTARNPQSVRNPNYHPTARAPCASNPLLAQYLTEWILGAAAQGVREVSLWLTEFQPAYCSCDTCFPDKTARPRQLQLETIASVKAFQAARKQYPDLTGRIFFCTQGANREVDATECLALLPADGTIKAEVVYGRQKAFDAHAADGKWVSTYSGAGVLSGAWGAGRGVFRLQYYADAAQVIDPIKDHFRTGYSGIYVPSPIQAGGRDARGLMEKNLCGHHIAMLAEFTWNAGGRTVDEFNRAWATRRGYANPGQAARWLEIITPVETAVLPAMLGLNRMLDAAKNRQAVAWGAGAWERFKSPEQLEDAMAAVRKSKAIADELQAPDLQAESDYVGAVLELLGGIQRLAAARAAHTDGADDARHLQTITAAVEKMLDAADRQMTVWVDVPDTVKQEFSKATRDYWEEQCKKWEGACKKN